MELDIKPVIVTALFDIGRDTWDTYTQSYGGYLHWMERTLSIQSPMVVFTEQQFIDQIKTMREKYYDITEYVVTTKEDLGVTKLMYTDIVNLMESQEFIDKIQFDVPEMTKPYYNILMFNKLWWLQEAKDLIDGTHYIWTDAGCYRGEISEVNKPFPTGKLNDKIIFFSHHPTISIADFKSHIMSQQRFVQGGSIVVPKDKIDYLTDQMYLTAKDMINQGYIGSDEKFLDLLYLNSNDVIDLMVCDWREYFNVLGKVD